MVVIHIARGEGSDALIVECIRGSGACFDDVAFVELELHFTGHVFLGEIGRAHV